MVLDAFDGNGARLPGGDDDRTYCFVNPPFQVPDGTYRQVPGPDGELRLVLNHTEDVPAAFRRMLIDDVLFRARRAGWRG